MLSFLLSITEERNRAKVQWLYDMFHTDMIRLSRSELKRMGDANYITNSEDVVQNAFVKLTMYADSIDINRKKDSLKAYVFAVVINEIKNFRDENRYLEEIGEIGELISDDCFFKELCVKERYHEVVRAIETLDVRYSATLLFYYKDGKSVKEIAQILGIPEKTVYSRLSRGKCRLLEKLKKE